MVSIVVFNDASAVISLYCCTDDIYRWLKKGHQLKLQIKARIKAQPE